MSKSGRSFVFLVRAAAKKCAEMLVAHLSRDDEVRLEEVEASGEEEEL